MPITANKNNTIVTIDPDILEVCIYKNNVLIESYIIDKDNYPDNCLQVIAKDIAEAA